MNWNQFSNVSCLFSVLAIKQRTRVEQLNSLDTQSMMCTYKQAIVALCQLSYYLSFSDLVFHFWAVCVLQVLCKPCFGAIYLHTYSLAYASNSCYHILYSSNLILVSALQFSFWDCWYCSAFT